GRSESRWISQEKKTSGLERSERRTVRGSHHQAGSHGAKRDRLRRRIHDFERPSPYIDGARVGVVELYVLISRVHYAEPRDARKGLARAVGAIPIVLRVRHDFIDPDDRDGRKRRRVYGARAIGHGRAHVAYRRASIQRIIGLSISKIRTSVC